MAGFKTHISTSSTLGVGYAALGAYYGIPLDSCFVAGVLCGVGGMLPDIDSDSGVPVRETMAFAAAVTPMLLVDRFEHLGLNYEQMVLAGMATYLFVRFGIARLLMRYTVHRGMFHSIPALLIFTGVAFLLCGSHNLQLRYLKAGGVFVGVLSHLVLDEIYAVEWTGGRWRFKKSFGTALKLWGDKAWSNFSAYSKLALVAVMILSEPSIMDRYGQLTPIVVNREELRQRFRIMPDVAPSASGLAGPASPAPWNLDPAWTASRGPTATPGTYDAGWPPIGPTAGSPPGTPGEPAFDRNVYDTARRIWKRFWK